MVNFFFVSKIVGVSEPTPKRLNRQIIVGLVHIILVLLSDGVIETLHVDAICRSTIILLILSEMCNVFLIEFGMKSASFVLNFIHDVPNSSVTQ